MSADVFLLGGTEYRRLWHCFGNAEHHIALDTIVELLRVSRTNVLPINTHPLRTRDNNDGLIIGYGDVTYDRLSGEIDLRPFIKMLNVNLSTDAVEAVDRTIRAHDKTGERVVKLEVLHAHDVATSNDAGLVQAVSLLSKRSEHLLLMPLLSADLRTAKELISLGCPLLRVMGSGIGTGRGIDDPDTFGKICALGVPVILDGGVGSAADYTAARELGAEGALINSMLYANGAEPAVVMRNFIAALSSTPIKVG